MKVRIWNCDTSATASVTTNAVTKTDAPSCTQGSGSWQTGYLYSTDVAASVDLGLMSQSWGYGFVFAGVPLVTIVCVRALVRMMNPRA